MKEVLGSPCLTVLNTVLSHTGTAPFTAVQNAVLTRDIFTGQGASRHASLFIIRGPATTNKSLSYVINHAASVTDAATNGTTLATVTRSAVAGTSIIDRVEIDMLGLQPAIGISVTSGTGGTAESIPLAVMLLASRPEQTPISSSSLASGNVTIIAAGGVTQSN